MINTDVSRIRQLPVLHAFFCIILRAFLCCFHSHIRRRLMRSSWKPCSPRLPTHNKLSKNPHRALRCIPLWIKGSLYEVAIYSDNSNTAASLNHDMFESFMLCQRKWRLSLFAFICSARETNMFHIDLVKYIVTLFFSILRSKPGLLKSLYIQLYHINNSTPSIYYMEYVYTCIIKFTVWAVAPAMHYALSTLSCKTVNGIVLWGLVDVDVDLVAANCAPREVGNGN